MATSLIINSTDTAGKAVAKSYTAINPDATDAELRDFATKINSLSDHTLDKIFRVDKKDITVDNRLDPNLTISPTSWHKDEGTHTINLTYEGEDRTVTVSGKKPDGFTITTTARQVIASSENAFVVMGDTENATMYITVAGDDTYKDATAEFTWTDYEPSDYVDI